MDTRKSFVADLTAGAVLLLLGLLVLATDWSNWQKALVVIAIVLVVAGAVLLMEPLRSRFRVLMRRRSRPSPPPAPPSLAEQIDETWFVTFTSGPYATGSDGREQYATAIAAVDRVDGHEVGLLWRDRGTFPDSVPIKLLVATQVYRFRNYEDAPRRVRVRNEGLRTQGPGGIVTGSGWRAHRTSPHRIAFTRYEALNAADRKAMEADADLGTYDLQAL